MANIIFESLALEITRRCNQKCAHCCRGDAQDVDISNKTIDTLLDNCSGIFDLFITGGEPTLCPERFRYLLEACKKRQIVIFSMHFITNGSGRTSEMVDVLKDWNEYLLSFYDTPPTLHPLRVCVSLDEFHNEEESRAGFTFWTEQLKDIAYVTWHSVGNIPRKMGRGVNVPYAIDDEDAGRSELVQIQYITDTHKPLCPQRYTRQVYNEEQIHVCCAIYMSVTGNLHASRTMPWTEEDSKSDSYISNIFEIKDNEDLIFAIRMYNIDKPLCKCGLIEEEVKPPFKKDGLNEIWWVYKGMQKIKRYQKKYAQYHPDPDGYLGALLCAETFDGVNTSFAEIDNEQRLALMRITGRDITLQSAEDTLQTVRRGITDAITPEQEEELREMLTAAIKRK